MAIVLTEHPISAKTIYSGAEGAIAAIAGQSLKIETSPGGEELLNRECPVGKEWLVRIIVEIEETDA